MNLNMTKQETKIIEIARELNRILTSGIEIHPNSPIHEKLNIALQPIVKNKAKRKVKESGSDFFKGWDNVIKNIKL